MSETRRRVEPPGERERGWDEGDSRAFLDLGRFFVPDREEQLATLSRLVPEPPAANASPLLVELCSGEGLLAERLLTDHPSCRLLALDGSEEMREATCRRLAGFGERVEVRAFELQDDDWRTFDEPPLAVLSMLSVHHLDAGQKRALFADVAAGLAPGGALLIADLVLPASALSQRHAARAWEECVRERSLALAGDERALERFRELGWNWFADPDPDPYDKPSRLLDQLRWMEEAGLEAVDAAWMRAGHAIFGGTRPAPDGAAARRDRTGPGRASPGS